MIFHYKYPNLLSKPSYVFPSLIGLIGFVLLGFDNALYILGTQFSSVQSLSHVRLFATPWIPARQASLSITNSRSSLNSRPSSQWCHPAISSSVIPFSSCPQSLPASESFPMRVFSTSTLRMRWPKYWSFSFSISPSNKHKSPISHIIKKVTYL